MIPIVSDPEPAPHIAALIPIPLCSSPLVFCVLLFERKDAMTICPRVPMEITVLSYIFFYEEEKMQ